MRKISRSNGKEYLDLAYEYVQELAEIENDTHMPKGQSDIVYFGHLQDPRIDNIGFYVKDILVGFMLVEQVMDKAAPFTHFIVETYVKPEYRRRNFVKDAIIEYMRNHKVKHIGYVVLPHNTIADEVWRKIFAEAGFNIHTDSSKFPDKFQGCKCYIANYHS